MWSDFEKDQEIKKTETQLPIDREELDLIEGNIPLAETPTETDDSASVTLELGGEEPPYGSKEGDDAIRRIQLKIDQLGKHANATGLCREHGIEPTRFFNRRRALWPERFTPPSTKKRQMAEQEQKEVDRGWYSIDEKLALINKVESIYEQFGKTKSLEDICSELNISYFRYHGFRKNLIKKGIIKPRPHSGGGRGRYKRYSKDGSPLYQMPKSKKAPRFVDVALEDLEVKEQPKAEKIFEFKGNKAQLIQFCKIVMDLTNEE